MSDKMNKRKHARPTDGRLTVRFNKQEMAFIQRSCRRRNVSPSMLLRYAIRELYNRTPHKAGRSQA